MNVLKQIWANIKSTPYPFQIALWAIVGGAVVVSLQECGAF